MNIQQQVFDKIVSHLRSQGKQSRNTLGDCVYKNTDGTSCAVGCLIEDQFYSPDIEGLSVEDIFDALSRSLGIPFSDVILLEELLNDLQATHDRGVSNWEVEVEDEEEVEKLNPGNDLLKIWEGCFQKIAARYNLIYVPPQSS